MYLSQAARWVLRGLCALVLVVLYAPILYVARLSVNTASNYAWPPTGFTLIGSFNQKLTSPASTVTIRVYKKN